MSLADLLERLLIDDPGVALGLPPGLELRWLGVAGFSLRYEGTTVVIDPYVSRAPLGDLVRRRATVSDPVAVDRWLPRADAVLVGHTHFDHAVDVPALARRDGAAVYGSRSAKHLLGLFGLADRAVEVEPHRPYEIGPFEVTFVPSVTIGQGSVIGGGVWLTRGVPAHSRVLQAPLRADCFAYGAGI